LFAFLVVTAFTAAVIRAVVMGILTLAAMEFGRKSEFLRAILFAAIFMAFINPAYLFYDVGFHLSFLSTLGVVYLSKRINLDFLPQTLGLKEAFVLTIAAQIATLPILIYHFGRVSLIAPVVNFFVAPFVPLIMLYGFFVIIFSFNTILVWPFVVIVSTLSYYLFLIVNFFAGLSWASVQIS
jgi:competence protein ComEC